MTEEDQLVLGLCFFKAETQPIGEFADFLRRVRGAEMSVPPGKEE